MLDRTASAEGINQPPDSSAAPQWELWFGRKISLVMMLTVLVPLLILAYGVDDRITGLLRVVPGPRPGSALDACAAGLHGHSHGRGRPRGPGPRLHRAAHRRDGGGHEQDRGERGR